MGKSSAQRISEDGITILRVAMATTDGGQVYIEVGMLTAAARRKRRPDNGAESAGQPLVEARASDNQGGRALMVRHPELGAFRLDLNRAAAEGLAEQLLPRPRRKR